MEEHSIVPACRTFVEAQTVRKISSLYEAAPETSNKCVPLFLQIGGMCIGIAKKSGPLATKFVDKLALVAHYLRINVQLSPTEKSHEPIPRKDLSFDAASQEDMETIKWIGQIVTNRPCNQLDYINVDSFCTFTPENCLILTARVVRQPENRGRVRNECAVLILSKMYGSLHSIAIFGHI